jgi:hypothetical protein
VSKPVLADQPSLRCSLNHVDLPAKSCCFRTGVHARPANRPVGPLDNASIDLAPVDIPISSLWAVNENSEPALTTSPPYGRGVPVGCRIPQNFYNWMDIRLSGRKQGYKPHSGVIDDQLMEQRPTYRAGFALDIALGLFDARKPAYCRDR